MIHNLSTQPGGKKKNRNQVSGDYGFDDRLVAQRDASQVVFARHDRSEENNFDISTSLEFMVNL